MRKTDRLWWCQAIGIWLVLAGLLLGTMTFGLHETAWAAAMPREPGSPRIPRIPRQDIPASATDPANLVNPTPEATPRPTPKATPAPTPQSTPEPTPTPAPTPRGSQTGEASWYRNPYDGCASRDVPRGTTVTVTSLENGRSATCRINDYGPEAWTGRIIDLDDDVFAQLAPLSQGVTQVRVTW